MICLSKHPQTEFWPSQVVRSPSQLEFQPSQLKKRRRKVIEGVILWKKGGFWQSGADIRFVFVFHLGMSKGNKALLVDLLKATSRSFYLTLGVLPARVRPQIGLAYLLARTTDTGRGHGDRPAGATPRSAPPTP